MREFERMELHILDLVMPYSADICVYHFKSVNLNVGVLILNDHIDLMSNSVICKKAVLVAITDYL